MNVSCRVHDASKSVLNLRECILNAMRLMVIGQQDRSCPRFSSLLSPYVLRDEVAHCDLQGLGPVLVAKHPERFVEPLQESWGR